MRNSSDGSDNWGEIFFNFDVMSFIEGPYFSKQSENSERNEFFFDSTLQIHLMSFRFSHDSNPGMGTDFI